MSFPSGLFRDPQAPRCDCECNCSSSEFSDYPVRYVNGEVQYAVDDVSSGGFGLPWGHRRFYTNRLQKPGGTSSENVGLGFNWLSDGWPWCYEDASGNVSVMRSQQEVVFFDLVSGNYVPKHGFDCTLTHDTTNHLFVFKDEHGNTLEFNDSASSDPEGLFKRATSPGNRTTTVTSYDGGLDIGTVERNDGAAENVRQHEQFKFDYTSNLASVTLQRKQGTGSWSNSHNVLRAVYTYYGASENFGSEGDLKKVEHQFWTGSAWETRRTYYYRYYKSGDSGGFMHGLKFVFGPAAFDRLDNATGISDPFTDNDAAVAPYADLYFEYGSDQRVTKERIRGTGPGSKTFEFTYPTVSSGSGYNSWKTKTVETQPDSSKIVVFTNDVGQVLLRTHETSGGTVLSLDHQVIGTSGATLAKVLERKTGDGITAYTANSNGTISLTIPDTSKTFTRLFTYYASDSSGIDEDTPGGAEGYVEFEEFRLGESGTPAAVRKFEYFKRTAGGSTVYPVAKEYAFKSETGGGDPIITEYAYQWHSGTQQIKERITKLPVVATTQNGPGGSSKQRVEQFDANGNLEWIKDERGFITRHVYDVRRGRIVQTIEDVNTSTTTDEPTGWTTPSGGGKHVITDYEYDNEDRQVTTIGPIFSLNGTNVRSVSWTVYKDLIDEVWSAQGYQPSAGGTPTLVNPVSVQRMDADGVTLEMISAARGSSAESSGALSSSDTYAQSSYVRWTKHILAANGLPSKTHVYHDIPTTGVGTKDTNYAESTVGYDASGRQNKSVAPGGTITRTTFDSLGRVTGVYVGTDDTGATDTDPTNGGTSPNNMKKVEGRAYYGSSTQHGQLQQVTHPVDGTSGNDRVTTYEYDARGRTLHVIREDAQGSGRDIITKHTYDNLDRTTMVQVYHTDATVATNLVSQVQTYYDDQGRVYETKTFPVSSGTAGSNFLSDKTWYDAQGHVIKSQPAGSKAFTKHQYDSLGRQAKSFVGYDLDESTYAEAETVTGDTIFEQTENEFDNAGNLLQVATRRRFHLAVDTQTGELTTPSGSDPKARVTYVAFWFDGIGRTKSVVDYGTNGGSSFTRPASADSASDTKLRTNTDYNADGEAYTTTDAKGTVTEQEFDAAGRRTKLTENKITGTAADKNRTTRFEYNSDGLLKKLIAENSTTGNQETQYVYGSSAGGITPAIYRNDLLRAVIYPDSVNTYSGGYTGTFTDGVGGYDRVEYKYNRQGQAIELKDQNGTVHEYDYDKSARRTADRVATLGTNIDGTVRRIELSYADRGPLDKVTSYDAATGGNVVNEVELVYNAYGQLQFDKQDHGGGVQTNTPKVEYAYTDGSANHVRPVKIVYPNGRKLHFTYGAANSIADALSRVDAIADDNAGNPGTHLADYSYLGLGGIVKVDLTEPDLLYTLAGGAGSDPYDGEGSATGGLDRFGRVVNLQWIDYGPNPDVVVEQIKHGYDRASNRVWRECPVPAGLSPAKHFDEAYGYDGLYQLATFQRGNLAETGAIDSQTLAFDQAWTFDNTGNWLTFKHDGDGGGWELEQTREHNKANETGLIGATVGANWVDPVHDKAGNMTTMPQPAAPTSSYTCTYDAWNRLAEVHSGGSLIFECFYDGLNRRIQTTRWSGQTATEVRHFYYSASWQVLEERRGSSPNTADAERQFVRGLRYIDDLILRDRDANTTPDGVLEERLYALADANWNVTALCENDGDVVERYAYSAYGEARVLDSQYAVRGSTSYAWETRYAGYRWDVATELYCVRNRYLHAGLGRWITRDPIRAISLPSLYHYCFSSSLGTTDPYGLDVKEDSQREGRRRAYQAELASIRRLHEKHVYFNPAKVASLFDKLFSAATKQVTDVILDIKLEPRGGWNTLSETMYLQARHWGQVSSNTVVHESVHAYDDMMDIYLDSWPDNEAAEALAYTTEYLLYYANRLRVFEKDVIPKTKDCAKLKDYWKGAWTDRTFGMMGVFNEEIAWANVLNIEAEPRLIERKDIWDVTKHLDLDFKCCVLLPEYQKLIDKALGPKKCTLECPTRELPDVFR